MYLLLSQTRIRFGSIENLLDVTGDTSQVSLLTLLYERAYSRRDLDSFSQSINIVLLMVFNILKEFRIGGGHYV
jgi:hypothetical protein